MSQTTLNAQVRESTGKGIAHRLREAKRIPAVLYGPYIEKPMSIDVDPKALRAAIKGPRRLNTILTLDLGEAGSKIALLKEYQQHPLTRELLHADFYEVRLDKPVTVPVPIALTGRAAGVALGGILSQNRRTLDVECLPDAIPEAIAVDVSGMNFNDVLHVADVTPPAGVKINYLTNFTICVLSAPEGEEAGEAEEAKK